MDRSSMPFRVAAVQTSSVFFDWDAMVEKACGVIPDGRQVTEGEENEVS